MATEITTIQGKGAPLNATELDDNFINLRNAVDSVIAGTQEVPAITLDTTPASTPSAEGTLYWDAADGTLAINMAGGEVTQQVGLETYFKVRNVTGTTIPNGTPVMATGVVAGTDRLQVTPAIANGTIQSVRFIGLVTEPLNNSSNGYSTCFGFVRDVNTTGSSVGETWAIGDLLYISQTTAGKLTKVAPTSGLKILAAIVVTVNATTGILLTRATPGVIIEDVYFKAEVDTKLAEKMSTASYTGAIGNITSPLLHLPLKNSLAFSQGVGSINFERTSTATYVDRYGMLKSVAADVPRFTADGLLIEGASTNLLTYSEQFDNAAWTKAGTTITANTTAVTDPYGTNLADKIIEKVSAGGSHSVYQGAISYTAGTTYTFPVFVKKAERSKVRLSFGGTAFGSGGDLTFDLNTKTQTISGSLTAKYVEMADGWFRLSVTMTAIASESGASPVIYIINDAGEVNYAGDGTSGLYIFGAQLEALPFATSYIPTTTAAATRAADVCSFPLADNMVKLQQSTGHTYIVDIMRLGVMRNVRQIILGGDTNTSFLLGLYNNLLGAYNKYAAFNEVTLPSALTEKTRLACVYTGYSTDAYAHGIKFGTGTTLRTYEVPGPIFLGKDATGGYLYGTISNLRIYDRALTAEEVRLA